MDAYLTADEVAVLIKLSLGSIRRYTINKEIPFHTAPVAEKRRVGIRTAEIRHFWVFPHVKNLAHYNKIHSRTYRIKAGMAEKLRRAFYTITRQAAQVLSCRLQIIQPLASPFTALEYG